MGPPWGEYKFGISMEKGDIFSTNSPESQNISGLSTQKPVGNF
jgi:hypothetical protein